MDIKTSTVKHHSTYHEGIRGYISESSANNKLEVRVSSVNIQLSGDCTKEELMELNKVLTALINKI